MSIRISLPESQWRIFFSHSNISDPMTSCRSTILFKLSLISLLVLQCLSTDVVWMTTGLNKPSLTNCFETFPDTFYLFLLSFFRSAKMHLQHRALPRKLSNRSIPNLIKNLQFKFNKFGHLFWVIQTLAVKVEVYLMGAPFLV